MRHVFLLLWAGVCSGQDLVEIPWKVDPLNATNYTRTNLPAWWSSTNDYSAGVRLWQMSQAINANFTLLGGLYSNPPVRWRDQIISGMALGAGASAPGVVAVSGGFIQGMGFAHGEDAHASCQLNHDLAGTNAGFPHFYIEPHVHVSPVSLSGGTNATFRLVYEWANVGGVFTNIHGAATNSLAFTNLFEHRILGFGYLTNDSAARSVSSVFRFGIERLDGGAGDLGNTRAVIVDSVDVHYPVKYLGSSTPTGN